MIQKTVAFPVGWHELHPDMSFNFQMNRFYELAADPTMLEEMKKVAPELHNYPDYIKTFLRLSDEAAARDEKLKAACYLRGAEFFITADDPRKIPYRNKFIALMKSYYGIGEQQCFLIPYETGFLSAYRLASAGEKGTVVVFGGYDSYIEEFLPMLMALNAEGYDIICFEGPGQGTPLEDYKLPMTNEWEKPVKAVLDYFKLDNVTLMGISLGGYLVVRAAAFEKRVKRVIVDDALTDFYNAIYNSVDPVIRRNIDNMIIADDKDTLNAVFQKLMDQSLLMNWVVKQGMHITGTKTPFEYMKIIKTFVSKDISSLLTQDVLLMAAQDDHYIPISQFYDQITYLTNVRSLTARMFTKAENAQNHCHIGNIGLSIDVIVNWLDQMGQ